MQPKIIVILGPTASGKSDLAVKIAKRFNGEIISADSRQVYRGLNIGSGKITKKEMRGIPHYLLGVASPKKFFSVDKYKQLAQKSLNKILSRGKIPIICGGTGLYIDSLIYNYQFPAVPPDIKLRKKLENLTTAKLLKKLEVLDSEYAKKIDTRNPRRLMRAIEIATALGKIPELKKEARYDILKIGLRLPDKKIKANIEKRLYKRLGIGMIAEVKKLHDQGLSWKKLDNFGLEYRFLSRYLRGLITKEEMRKLILKESFRYAKRQMTWFKRDKETIWINKPSGVSKRIEKFLT